VDAPELVSTVPAHRAAGAETRPSRRARRVPVSERRARLVVQCACELLGIDPASAATDLQLALSVQEFEYELRRRYAGSHPELIYRTDSTLERARLERARLPWLPRVILRRGAPPRSARAG
jgi:hypothetical protein